LSTSSWVIAIAAALLAAAVTGWVRRQALQRQWLDVPNERSSHHTPTPRGGGLGIVIASVLGFATLWITGAVDAGLCIALVGGGLMVAWIGFRDDRAPVGPGARLAVHMAAAGWALAWLGGVPPIQFGATTVEFGVSGYLLGALAIGWVLNLFNFMDGIDGIAASEAAFMALAGALLAGGSSALGVPAAGMVFGAACLGFLAWNWPPAKIFMGDVGSGFLGYVLAVLALAAMWESPVALFAWLALGGVFFVDASVTLVRRLLRGERVHQAHRSHAYQWLARRWGAHLPVTLSVLSVNFLVLLPVAGFCMAYPERAASALVAALAALAVVALLAGAGRAEVPPPTGAPAVRHSKE
jgi:Fuc2NAc and GlcNAc transferase